MDMIMRNIGSESRHGYFERKRSRAEKRASRGLDRVGWSGAGKTLVRRVSKFSACLTCVYKCNEHDTSRLIKDTVERTSDCWKNLESWVLASYGAQFSRSTASGRCSFGLPEAAISGLRGVSLGASTFQCQPYNMGALTI